ncbi:hypothetical protein Tco_0483328 [Tanacetum coccineum]
MTGESNSHLERAASTERCLQPWQVEDPLSRNCTRKSEPDRGSAKFSDDVLFFGESSRANAKNLIHILHCYEAALSLKVNFTKSRLFGIGVASEDVNGVASSLGCAHDEIPFIYLGLSRLFKNFMVMMEVLGLILIFQTVGDIDVPSRSSFILNVSNGSNISFWKDLWCAGIPWLIDVFPRLYALESFKDLKVNNCWVCENRVWGQGTWAWHFPLRVRALNDLSPLIELIGNTTLSPEASTNGLGLMKLWHL